MLNTFDDYNNETNLVEKVFVELIEFIDGAGDAEILVKISDISEFVRRSFEKLEKQCQSGLAMKDDIYISDKLTPYIVDTRQSIQIVNMFEMKPPSKEIFNVFDLKFLKQKPTHAQTQAHGRPKLAGRLTEEPATEAERLKTEEFDPERSSSTYARSRKQLQPVQ